ncbi:OmpA family protein [Spirillospora albida]|uniref:OmpA family protein n=1 Tax=Spirillospora albida TaxID=58123 RepID=UPI0014707C65|nr:OmpA family protein [Spirillospora albida]
MVKTGAVVAAMTLALAACGGGEEKKAPPKKTSPSSGGAPAANTPLQTRPLAVGSSVLVDLMALDRVSPKAVVARWRIRNTMDSEYSFGPALKSPWNSPKVDSNAVSGISLLDGKNAKRYFPMEYNNGRCLCTREWPTVPAKASKDLVAVFPAPPADVTHMDALFPSAPPFLDVQLGSRPVEPVVVDSGGGKADPNTLKAGEPQVFPLTEQVDDDSKAQDDDGNNLRVRLSTDVLFALNKADLTPKAQSALKDVAAKIDQSAGNTVQIDGHTDNSGNDAINNPLSDRRAQTVKAALQRLVTRQGVEYRTKGHGSREPIATNENAEGRRVNRRVTVQFTKPKPPATSSAAPPTSQAPTADGKLPVIGTARSGNPPWIVKNDWPTNAEVRINELRRDRHGYVSLVWTIRNDDAKALNAWSSSYDHSGIYAEASTSAAAIVSGQLRYRALRDSEHRVTLGPNLISTDQKEYMVEKGEEYTLWAMFKLPPEVKTANVHIPGFLQVQNLPVG